jgi:hypothetical protein
MKRCSVSLLALVLLAIGFWACEKSDNGVSPPPTSAAQTVYVINSLGMTISAIDVSKDTIYNNVATIGKWANQVVYYSGKLYVVSSYINGVQVFDASTYAQLGTIDCGASTNPMCIAILSDTKAYVTCSQANCVKVVNPTAYTVTKTINTDVGTTGILIANNKVYVANTAYNSTTYGYGQGTIQVINTTADTVAKTINVGMNPQALALDPTGMVHALSTGDYFSAFGEVAIINPSTDAVTQTVAIGGSPGNIALSAAGIAYCGMWSTGMITYNTSTKAIIHSSASPLLGLGASSVVFDKNGNAFVGDFSNDKVYKLNSADSLVRTYLAGDGPIGMCVK